MMNALSYQAATLCAPRLRTVDASYHPDPYAGALSAAVPLVTLVRPVATVHPRHEPDLRQILRVLVPELDRRVDARRRPVRGLERFAVETISDDSLLVHRALDVPALVVVVVE